MIQVTLPDSFLPERTYAIHALFTHFLGIPVTIQPGRSQRDYRLRWREKTVVIEDGFFGKLSPGQSYLDPTCLPEPIRPATAPGLESIVRLFGRDHLHRSPDHVECGVDLVAGAFFLLTRWEESLPHTPDLHGRFPAGQARIVRDGHILRPVVDEYVALLRHWLRDFGYPLPDRPSGLRIAPTCDVDLPLYWPKGAAPVKIATRFLRHRSLRKLRREVADYRATRQGRQSDPYDQFAYILKTAATHDLPMTWYFIGGGKTKYEGQYTLGDPFIRSLMREVSDRGHHIGLHPSYDAGRDVSYISAEKNALEKACGHPVTRSRQHYLRFTVPDTWRRLAGAGIAIDSTVGYAAEPGFRCGTSHAFPVFDIHRRETLPLLEQPLLVMDVSLRWYKQLTVPEALDLCQAIKAQVAKHDGEFVFLWHNSNLSDVEGWTPWRAVFESLFLPE